jgi:haloacetate dehalogenase
MIWESWCSDLTGASVSSGHHIAEENPDALSAALIAFLEAS